MELASNPSSGVEPNGEEVVIRATRQQEDCSRNEAFKTRVLVDDSTQHVVVRLHTDHTETADHSAV